MAGRWHIENIHVIMWPAKTGRAARASGSGRARSICPGTGGPRINAGGLIHTRPRVPNHQFLVQIHRRPQEAEPLALRDSHAKRAILRAAQMSCRTPSSHLETSLSAYGTPDPFGSPTAGLCITLPVKRPKPSPRRFHGVRSRHPPLAVAGSESSARSRTAPPEAVSCRSGPNPARHRQS